VGKYANRQYKNGKKYCQKLLKGMIVRTFIRWTKQVSFTGVTLNGHFPSKGGIAKGVNIQKRD
jgi:hypothetical protein